MTDTTPHKDEKAEHKHTEKKAEAREKKVEHAHNAHEKKAEHTHEHKEGEAHTHDTKKHVTHEHKKDEKHEHTKGETHTHAHEKKDEKHDEKKPVKKETPKVKKEDARVFGRGMPISRKHASYICSFIKFKDIDTAIKELGEVTRMKRVIPFKGEIPHRKGPGMMSGRYPVKAAEHFIPILKGLKGNALVNGLALERTKISSASANWGARPMRRGGREKGKRTHVTLVCREMEGKQ